MKKKSWLLIFSSLLLLFLLYNSSFKKQNPPNMAAKTSERFLRLNLTGDPLTLDPRKGGDLISSRVQWMLYEGLMAQTEDGTVECAQAERVEQSEDGKTYVFHLRDSFWSNGDAVTAQDFRDSWQAIVDPSFPALNAQLLYPILNAEKIKSGQLPPEALGVRAIDDKTLEVLLERPTPYFLELVSFCVFFPVNQKINQSNPLWATFDGDKNPGSVTSNGPYCLESWSHGSNMRLVKNKRYWQAPTLPKNGGVLFTMLSNPMTAWRQFLAKELDYLGEPLSILPREAAAQLEAEGRLIHMPNAATTFLAFNVHHSLLQEIAARKALAYALNREALATQASHIGAKASTQMLHPILTKRATAHPIFSDNNPLAAQALWNTVTVPRKKLTLLYNAGHEQGAIVAQIIQHQWKTTLGFEVELEGLETASFWNRINQREFDIVLTNCIAQYPDCMNILDRFKRSHGAKNYPGWEDQEYIQLLELSAEQQGEARLKTMEAAEKLLLEKMPLTPLYHTDLLGIAQKELKGLQKGAEHGNFLAERLYFEK